MKPELTVFDQQARAAIEEAKALFDKLTNDQAIQRPAPDKWSPAECLDHLTLTADAFTRLIDQKIKQGPKRSTESYQPGWLARWFLSTINTKNNRAFKTTPDFIPGKPTSGATSLNAFIQSHESLLARIPQLEPLDLRKTKVTSPFVSWMTYSLGLVCYLVPAHCRRHLQQARNALN